MSLLADNRRGDEGTGETTEIRRAGMDALEIDEGAPESAARAINRRKIINLNGGDDGGSSETPETFKAKHMQEEVGRLRRKSSTVAPRSYVRRENRLLEPASLREQKDTRQRHRSIVSVAFAADFGPVERAPGRRATAMVEDGIVKDFAVLSRVRVAAGRVESVEGCKKCSRLQRDQVFCNFLCNCDAFCNPKYGEKGPDTERARAVWTPYWCF